MSQFNSMQPLRFAPLSRPRVPSYAQPQNPASLHDDADLVPMPEQPRPLIAGGQGRPHFWPADLVSPPGVLDRCTDRFDPDAGGGAFGACMFVLGAFAGSVVVALLVLFGRE